MTEVQLGFCATVHYSTLLTYELLLSLLKSPHSD
jgi:hypothetical protein